MFSSSAYSIVDVVDVIVSSIWCTVYLDILRMYVHSDCRQNYLLRIVSVDTTSSHLHHYLAQCIDEYHKVLLHRVLHKHQVQL